MAVSIVVVVLAMVLAAPVTGRVGSLFSSDSSTGVGHQVSSEARVAEAATGAFLPAMPMVSSKIEEALRRAEQAQAEAAARAHEDKVASESKVSSSKSSVSSGEAHASSSGSSEVRSSVSSSSGSSKSSSSVRVSNSSSASASSSGSSVSSSGSSTAHVSASQEVSGGDGATCYAESFTSAEIFTPDGVVSDSDHTFSDTC